MALKKTYGKLKIDGKDIVLFDVEPHVCMRIKSIFPKIKKTAIQPFIFSLTDETCHDILWFIERYPLEISSKDMESLSSHKKTHIDTLNAIETILLPDYVPTSSSLKSPYVARNYQLLGKDVFLKVKRLLLGDDIGLGKTMVSILACLNKETLPCAVVVQTHLPNQFKEEFAKYTTLNVHVIKSRMPYDLPPADVYIFKYGSLSGWVNIFETGMFKSVHFDEIQELRRHESNRYQAASVLASNTEYCLGLSASPIYNYGNEIFNVMNIIKRDCLGSFLEFSIEWMNYGNKIVNNPAALGTYLRDNFLMLRRTRKEVGRELPPINKIVYTVDYDEKAVKKSEDLAKTLAMKVIKGSFVERGQAARDLDILLRHNTGVSKAFEVSQFVKILLDNDEPTILAGWHRDCYDIWLKELASYNPVMYTGSETAAQKEAAKQAFINRETNLFIISLRSGVGLDGLQSVCKTVVFGELDWSPKVHEQLIGRADRDGQKYQVDAYFLVSNYGSDPMMVNLLGLKASQSDQINDPLKVVTEQFSDESRLKQLAMNFLKKTTNE